MFLYLVKNKPFFLFALRFLGFYVQDYLKYFPIGLWTEQHAKIAFGDCKTVLPEAQPRRYRYFAINVTNDLLKILYVFNPANNE